jgi:phenylalanyl-tRNA synthetase beta chain
MNILLSWLKEYIDINETPEKIADALAMAGIEVEAIQQPGKNLKNIVTGKIVAKNAHPNAEKLSLCELDVGKPEHLQIVCGAQNHKAGDIVPVALIGATLPNGMEIRKAKLRGVESSGMLCSKQELGLGEDHSGLYILPAETKIGENIVTVLGLDEVILEIAITPNRGDALSHLGIARELSAIFNIPLHRNALAEPGGEADVVTRTSVTNQAPELCPRYGARVIEGVRVTESPKWLKDRLEKIGLRTINNIVDITNYVMMDIGHPMHAFDLDLLDEQRIVVRPAAQGEAFTALDKEPRKLDASMLVIADAKKPVALAGVMGGLDSSVSEKTTRVLLEAAYFDPTCVRKTAKTLGMMSDSSYRFERGTNVDNIPIALNLATKLILETAGGTALKGIIDSHPNPQPLRRIMVRSRRVSQLLGIELKPHQIETILCRLKIEVTKEGADFWVGVPPYRHDIEQEVDIIEEIARIYGYQNIPTTLPAITSVVQLPTSIQTAEKKVQDFLIGAGFHQIISYSFIPLSTPQAFLEGMPLSLKNPLSEEQGILRTGLLPGLVEALRHNFQVDEFDLKFFEIGRIFHRASGDTCQEQDRLSIGISGRANPTDWRRNADEYDLFVLKGLITSVARLCGQKLVFKPGSREALHPSLQLEIKCGTHHLGYLGKLHPRFLDNKKFPQNVLVAEIDLGLLAVQPQPTVKMKAIPEFPAMRRDLALEVPLNVTHEELLTFFREKGGTFLEKCSLFDVYQGKGIEPNHRSMAFNFVFRSVERTLTDPEVQPIMDTFISGAERHFQAKLRSR